MNTNTTAASEARAELLFGTMTVTEVAEVFGTLFDRLTASTVETIDVHAPPSTTAQHVARLEAERLFALAQSGELDPVAQCDAYMDACRELREALPAVLPLRTAETYETLRDMLQSFTEMLLSVRMDLAARHTH